MEYTKKKKKINEYGIHIIININYILVGMAINISINVMQLHLISAFYEGSA